VTAPVSGFVVTVLGKVRNAAQMPCMINATAGTLWLLRIPTRLKNRLSQAIA
jgi:hypothetical protein